MKKEVISPDLPKDDEDRERFYLEILEELKDLRREASESISNVVPEWGTLLTYQAGQKIYNGHSVFLCIETHTSGTFVTDWITNEYWVCLGDAPGDMKICGTSTLESGWLLCDGSAISRTTYELLFARIGTTWGVGDGSTTFNIPDLQGAYLRGAGSHGSETMADGNPFAGPSIGNFENDQMQQITGSAENFWGTVMTDSGAIATTKNAVNNRAGTAASNEVYDLDFDSANSTAQGGARTGDETRPFAAGVNFIIKI